MFKLLLFLLLVLISSCSIQKRHFNKGYDVHWKGYYASNSNDYSEAASEEPEPCDTIQNKDGSLTLAIVERIDSKKIYVTPCDNSTYRENSIDRAVVSTIHYANGALFENKTPEQLQKEREENLEKYRQDQYAIEKELLEKEKAKELERDRQEFENQRLQAENAALQRQNDSLKRVQSELKNVPNDDSLNNEVAEKIPEPLMRNFFTVGFSIAALTLLLSLVDPFYGALSLISLLVLFIADLVSPFIVLVSLIRKKRDKNKYSGRPVLLELLFAAVSFGTLLVWVVFQF